VVHTCQYIYCFVDIVALNWGITALKAFSVEIDIWQCDFLFAKKDVDESDKIEDGSTINQEITQPKISEISDTGNDNDTDGSGVKIQISAQPNTTDTRDSNAGTKTKHNQIHESDDSSLNEDTKTNKNNDNDKEKLDDGSIQHENTHTIYEDNNKNDTITGTRSNDTDKSDNSSIMKTNDVQTKINNTETNLRGSIDLTGADEMIDLTDGSGYEQYEFQTDSVLVKSLDKMSDGVWLCGDIINMFFTIIFATHLSDKYMYHNSFKFNAFKYGDDVFEQQNFVKWFNEVNHSYRKDNIFDKRVNIFLCNDGTHWTVIAVYRLDEYHNEKSRMPIIAVYDSLHKLTVDDKYVR
jgi:hypothetical protein